MAINFIAQIAIGLAIAVIGYLLAPKPKPPKPPAVEDLKDPTAEAGRPIPVVFGSGAVTGLNLMGAWDKEIHVRKVKMSKK